MRRPGLFAVADAHHTAVLRASRASLSAANPSTMLVWKSITSRADILGSMEREEVMAWWSVIENDAGDARKSRLDAEGDEWDVVEGGSLAEKNGPRAERSALLGEESALLGEESALPGEERAPQREGRGLLAVESHLGADRMQRREFV
jgi:hypothetical protein